MPAVSTNFGVSDGQNVPTYVEGTWTPTFTSATVVGSPVYAGRYTRIGRAVFFEVSITGSVGNTFASTAGTTYCNNFPFTCARSAFMGAANATTNLALTNGIAKTGTTNLYVPTLTASTTDTYVITGVVEV